MLLLIYYEHQVHFSLCAS